MLESVGIMFRNSLGHKLSSFRLCFRIELGNLETRWGAQQFHWSAQKTSKTLSRKYNAFLYQPVQSRHTINKYVQRQCTSNVCTLNTVESEGRTTTLCLRTEWQQQQRPTAKRSLDLNIINEVIATVNRARCVWFTPTTFRGRFFLCFHTKAVLNGRKSTTTPT